jgi:hypothetical protein
MSFVSRGQGRGILKTITIKVHKTKRTVGGIDYEQAKGLYPDRASRGNSYYRGTDGNPDARAAKGKTTGKNCCLHGKSESMGPYVRDVLR